MEFIPKIDDRFEPVICLIAADREAGLKQLRGLVEAGDKSAMLYLELDLSEEGGTTDAAFEWLLLADRFDSPDAPWNLAMIARERGDFDEMKRWIDRAAELSEEDAIAIQGSGYEVESVIAK